MAGPSDPALAFRDRFVVRVEPSGDQSQWGSGVLLGPRLVATCRHVVERNDGMLQLSAVVWYGRHEYEASVHASHVKGAVYDDIAFLLLHDVVANDQDVYPRLASGVTGVLVSRLQKMPGALMTFGAHGSSLKITITSISGYQIGDFGLVDSYTLRQEQPEGRSGGPLCLLQPEDSSGLHSDWGAGVVLGLVARGGSGRADSFAVTSDSLLRLHEQLNADGKILPKPDEIEAVTILEDLARPRPDGTTAVVEELLLPGRDPDGQHRFGAHPPPRTRLRVEGAIVGDRVSWRYFHADRNQEIGASTASLVRVREGMRALRAKHHHRDVARALGRALAECLFGQRGEEFYHQLFRRLHGYEESETPSTVAQPVACRIATTEPELRRLPWRLAFDCDRWLADEGWVFDVSGASNENQDITLPNPCTVMMVHSDNGVGARWAQDHMERVQEQLQKIWGKGLRLDQYLVRVHRRNEIEQVFDDGIRRPELIYVVAEVGGGTHPGVWLDSSQRGTEQVPLTWLIPRLAENGALALYLTGPTNVGVDIDPAWSQAIPCIVTSRGTGDPEAAHRAGLAWLYGLLARSLDPVNAAHEVPTSGPSLQWAAAQVYSRFRRWRTEQAPPSPAFEDSVLRIDRKPQRSGFVSRVAQLARQSRQRVVSFIACGTEDDLVSRLGDQLAQELYDGMNDKVRVHRWVTPFPPAGKGLEHRLDAVFRRVVGIDADEDPADVMLARFGIEAIPSEVTVLWFDWGQVGLGGEVKSFDVDDIKIWLKFSAERLPTLCPPRGLELRIISTLGIGLRHGDIEAFEADLSELRTLERGIQTSFATVEVLPALGQISTPELEQILRDHSELCCPEDLVIPAAQALNHMCDGRYAKVVNMIRGARTDDTWESLIKQSGVRIHKKAERRQKRRYGDV